MACGDASRAARDSLDLRGEPGSALRKSGVGPGFCLRLRGFRRFVARMSEAISGNNCAASLPLPGSRFAHPGYEINEGSGTPANAGYQPPHLADAARALSERARLPAFHHGSHLRELFHPKGSASGQASWDVVSTGVTRLRLLQRTAASGHSTDTRSLLTHRRHSRLA